METLGKLHFSERPFEFSRNMYKIGIFVLLNSENKLDVVISHVKFISKHHDKCTFA